MRSLVPHLALILTVLLLSCGDKRGSVTHDSGPDDDTQSPKAWITSPADSAVVALPETLRVTATDDHAVVLVLAFEGADTLGAAMALPYAFAFDTTLVGPDTLTFSAEAWDAAGNFGHSDTVTVFLAPAGSDVEAPLVSITAPADGDSVSMPDTLHIVAVDDVGVVRVTAYEDGDSIGGSATPPYAIPFQLSGMTPDTLRFSAAARDEAGNVGLSDTVTVIVPFVDLQPPTVAILVPLEGAEIDGSATVEIFAIDNDSVQSVWLFVDDVDSIAVDGPPYHHPWSPDADGDWHTLLARAWDLAGNHTDSDTVNVRVLPGDYDPPLPWAPAQGALLHNPVLVEFRWAGVFEAIDYQFELASDAAFSSLIYSEVLADSTLTYLAPPEGLLHWRVRAGRARSVWGEWCETRRFFAGEVFDGELLSGYDSSRGRDLAPTPDGNLLVAGSHAGNLLLMKLAVTGELIWVRQYFEEYASATAHRLAPREGGGWMVLCQVGMSNWTTSVVVLDVSADGEELGRRELGAPFGAPVAMLPRPGNGVVALFEGTFYQTYRIVEHIDAGGGRLWREEVGTGNSGSTETGSNNTGQALLDDVAAGQLVVLREDEWWGDYGDSWSTDVGCTGRDASTGEVVWDLELLHGQEIEGNPTVVPRPTLGAAHLSGDGAITCAGSQGDEALLVRIDPDRVDFTVTTLAGLEPTTFHDMDRLSTGAIVLAGTRGGHLRNAIVLLCDELGNVIWERILGEPWDADEFFGLAVLPGDDIAVVGTSATYGQHSGGSLWYRRLDMYGADITP